MVLIYTALKSRQVCPAALPTPCRCGPRHWPPQSRLCPSWEWERDRALFRLACRACRTPGTRPAHGQGSRRRVALVSGRCNGQERPCECYSFMARRTRRDKTRPASSLPNNARLTGPLPGPVGPHAPAAPSPFYGDSFIIIFGFSSGENKLESDIGAWCTVIGAPSRYDSRAKMLSHYRALRRSNKNISNENSEKILNQLFCRW